jgi:hypothetical protein
MAIFSKKDAFIKQIAVYLSSQDHEKAYLLSKEFVKAFPGEMIAHFLLAKSAFWADSPKETVSEGKKALIMAKPQDIVACAILTASGHYRLGNYKEGQDLLKSIDSKGNEDLERMRFAFALAMGNGKEAVYFLEELNKINRKAVESLIKQSMGT